MNGPDFWQPGVLRPEHLVNMSWHYYREEPNVRFSPDKKLVIFTSNMFGPSYVFGAEVEKAVDPAGRRRGLNAGTGQAVQPYGPANRQAARSPARDLDASSPLMSRARSSRERNPGGQLACTKVA